MSKKIDQLADMALEGLLLFERIQMLDEDSGDATAEEQVELAGKMLKLVVRLAECPEHGAPEPGTVSVDVTRKESGFSFSLDGLCCEKMNESANNKLSNVYR